MKIIILLIIILKIYSNFPVYKIIISNNTNEINEYDDRIITKGTALIFDPNSEYNLFPYDYFNLLKEYYSSMYLGCFPFFFKLENGLTTLKCEFYEDLRLDTLNIITEDFGIKIPTKYLFYDKKYFVFSTSEEQENIIIGKNLMNLMEANIIEENNKNKIIINNNDFIIKIDDDI